jgi:hypothetical protein
VREPGLGEDVGVLQDGYTATVPAHGVVMVRVTGQSARLGDGGVFGPLPRPVPGRPRGHRASRRRRGGAPRARGAAGAPRRRLGRARRFALAAPARPG